jgi:hypothetical protein
MSCARWVALHCGEETEALLSRYPNAFLLLCQIAIRARWKDCPITNMKAGEAFIGDYKSAGLKTEKAYQVAKSRLAKCGLVAFKGENKGTRATLCSATIFSINTEPKGERGDTPTEHKGRSKGDQGETIHTETRKTQRVLPLPPEGKRESEGDAELVQRLKALTKRWQASPDLSAREARTFRKNRHQLAAFTAADWQVLKEFLAAKLHEGAAWFQPRMLEKFLENPGERLGDAQDWKAKQRTPLRALPPPPIQSDPAAPPLSRAEIAETLNLRTTR